MNGTNLLPLDVRMMLTVAKILNLVFFILIFSAAAWWVVTHPAFAIQAISVQGEVNRNNAVTLRANVVPQLSGNFFTIDLDQTRQAFEAVPWVRGAVLHRDFPNKLKAVLVEHHPIAIWGDEGANTMVNQQNQVFEASVDNEELDNLPRLKGPLDQAGLVAEMFHSISPIFEAMDMEIEMLELTTRGSWRVQTRRGAWVELGRGNPVEVVQRVRQFFTTLTQVTARYARTPASLMAADLRHKDGYALRLRGVTTLQAVDKKIVQ